MVHQDRIQLARISLTGVSIGDAFGESFFGPTAEILAHIHKKEIPITSWEFTDDTVMSIAIFEQLEKDGNIQQDELAKLFAVNHSIDPNRGYGATARTILRAIEEGESWIKITPQVFDGMGSMGNGAAMRTSAIGAYWFDNLDLVNKLCRKSAEITHANEEAIVGAIAIGVATALSTQTHVNKIPCSPKEFISNIVDQLPVSDTTSKIKKSLTLSYSYHIETVKSVLGNGSKMLSQDTVPFAIWCSAHNLNSFQESLWKAVSILGDRDTICAMVGGITIMSCKNNQIPQNWLDKVEKWEESPFKH